MKLPTGEGQVVEVLFVQVGEDMQDYLLRDHGLHVAVGTATEERTIFGDVVINSSSFLGRLQTTINKIKP